MECRTFALEELTSPKYVVVFTRYRGKLLLSRHRQRDTWETQGGHIEPGETPEQAARRELFEESGAADFSLTPLFDYYASDEQNSATGAVFLADVRTLSALPQSEMAEVRAFDALPDELTYPAITPVLFRAARERFPGCGL